MINVEETADLHITQNGQALSQLQLKAGQTYTFCVNNTAGFSHDFYLGPADQLSGNNTAGLTGVPSFDSGVQSFTFTVPANTQGWQFACTLPGHYQTMHGDLAVSP